MDWSEFPMEKLQSTEAKAYLQVLRVIAEELHRLNEALIAPRSYGSVQIKKKEDPDHGTADHDSQAEKPGQD